MSAGEHATPSFDLLSMDRKIQRRIARKRALKIAAWASVLAIGFKKGRFIGWLGMGAGVFALTRELLVWREEQPEWRKTAKPLREGFTFRRLLAGQSDPVDQASATSFPASDAPSHDGR
jgi:hypothetical protein